MSKIKAFAQTSRDNREQTASSFRVSSDFFFKQKTESDNKKETISPLNSPSSTAKAKIKIDKSLKGIKKVVDKYCTLKTSLQSLSLLSLVNIYK